MPKAPPAPGGRTHEAGDRPAVAPSPARRRRGAATGIWAAVALTAAAVGAAQSPPGQRLLDAAGAMYGAQPYSALSLEAAGGPPPAIGTGADTPLRFTIENREGATQTYRWQVRMGTATAPGAVVADGRVTLADGRTATLTAPVAAPCDPAASPPVLTVQVTPRDLATHVRAVCR